MCTEGGPTPTGEGEIDTTGQESISECVQRVVQLLQETVRQIYTAVTIASAATAATTVTVFDLISGLFAYVILGKKMLQFSEPP